jgi:arylsulfatase A-like enzyme
MTGTAVDNVVLLVVDALRRDRVGVHGGHGLTPRLDKLADSAAVFEQAYACINTTDPSITTMMTGQYPLRHGLVNHGGQVTDTERERLAGTVPLPERLRPDYRTIGCDVLGRWHERGFDEYLNPADAARGTVTSTLDSALSPVPTPLERRIRSGYRWLRDLGSADGSGLQYADADAVTRSLADAIDEVDRHWFAFGHYWDTHVRYDPPDEYLAAVGDRTYEDGDVPLTDRLADIGDSYWGRRLHEDLAPECETVGDVKRRYDAAVRYVDAQIGRLLDELDRRGLREDTAVVVTADHGESLTEHGVFFDHHCLYDQSIRVPLLIDAPGFDGQEDGFVQHFDLAPTLLDLLGEPIPETAFDGVSLVAADGDRTPDRDAVFAEEAHTTRRRAVRTRQHKYISLTAGEMVCDYCDVTHGPELELYDLETDPAETMNRAETDPDRAAALQHRLEQWTQALPNPETGRPVEAVDGDVLELLEDMGYK